MAPLLEVVDLTKRFGGVSAIHGVSFAAAPQEITTVIGPNGAGKTTLFNLITGFVPPTAGDVFYRGQRITGMPAPRVAGLGVIRTFQNLIIFNETTVEENVMVGCHRWTRTGFIQAALALPAAVREDRTVRETARAALALVGLEGRAHELARDLPFGQLRLLEIARALVARPSLLLLDEPTAGLSAKEARNLVTLIRRLRADGVTFVVIEHNMDVVMDAADRVIVLDYGEKIAEGLPQAVQRDPRVIAAYLGEETVVPGGAAARGGIEREARSASLLEVSGLIARRGDIEVLHGIDLGVRPGEVLAIIGPNGAGKSTLLGTIAGVYPARAGTIALAGRPITGLPAEAIVRLGISLVPERRQVFDTLTVGENLLLGGYPRYWRHRAEVRADVGLPQGIFPRLLDLDRRLGGSLSGGEQQMLAIGRGLMSRPRILLLDEPSLGLGPLVVREIVHALERLRRTEGLTVVLVEQNVKAAMAIADRVCVMERGRIVLRGTPRELLAHPGIKAAYLGKGYEIAG